MSTDFLQALGTNGYLLSSPLTVLTTEMNSLATGSYTALGPQHTQSDIAQGIRGSVFFKSGGSFTPTSSLVPVLYGWFARSPDGGTTYEYSTTLTRLYDFIIPLPQAAISSGQLFAASGVNLPLAAEYWKLIILNSCGATLPASGNSVFIGPTAWQY